MGGYGPLRAHPFFDFITWENLHHQTPPKLTAYLPAMSEDDEDCYGNVSAKGWHEGESDSKQPWFPLLSDVPGSALGCSLHLHSLHVRPIIPIREGCSLCLWSINFGPSILRDWTCILKRVSHRDVKKTIWFGYKRNPSLGHFWMGLYYGWPESWAMLCWVWASGVAKSTGARKTKLVLLPGLLNPALMISSLMLSHAFVEWSPSLSSPPPYKTAHALLCCTAYMTLLVLCIGSAAQQDKC